MTLSNQFDAALGRLTDLIDENRRMYPLPEGMYGGKIEDLWSPDDDLETKHAKVMEKIASTEVSNQIGRGERAPTEKRFG